MLAKFMKRKSQSQDYELLPKTGAAIIQVTMIHLMIRRLARPIPF